MPFTLNGIGTTLYGAREFLPDGSYITTEWLVLIYVPVIPLRSIRMLPSGDRKHYGVYSSSRYTVLEKKKHDVRQISAVYAWFAVVVGSFWAATASQLWWLAVPGVVTLGAPWFLRRRAIKRMTEKWVSEASEA